MLGPKPPTKKEQFEIYYSIFFDEYYDFYP
jgi:hypothetical protein